MTDSLFAGGGYNTPRTNAPFLSVSPLELVSKNFQSGTVTFSRANSIFVQSHTDLLNGTSVSTKKTETCFGRWEQGLEPLHIQVPPLPAIANVTIKSENISSGSGSRNKSSDGIAHYPNTCLTSTTNSHSNNNHNSSSSNSRENGLNSGCSRTIPISWTAGSSTSSSTNFVESQRNIECPVLQIKREPCQVSEISTSNNKGHTLATVVKFETSSPKRTMENIQNSAAQSAGAIPVGIAVARQRLQEQNVQHHQQPKDLNRFGIGIATDLGGATSAFSQNMFFTGTNSTMIPFSSEAVTMGVSNAVRTPPTIWQYPTPVPVESMLQMPIPPVGFQLVRDPSTGQLLFLPTATSIDKMYISYPEPFPQAVVWPSYPQPALQAPHLLMPSLTPQMQPPPLTPLQLLGSDYLGGATLHQHTQTHSTRLVAVTSDTKRKSSVPSIPLPIQPTTLIKIEDCSSDAPSINTTATSRHQSLYEPCKPTAIQTATITTAVQTNDLSPDLSTHQLYFQSEGNLIQIAQQSENSSELMESVIESRTTAISPLMENRTFSSSRSSSTEPIEADQLDSTSLMPPDVQDANVQTDTPVMSEDDNTTGAEDCSFLSSSPMIINAVVGGGVSITSSTSYQDLCHNITSISEVQSDSSFTQTDAGTNKADETSFGSSNTTVTSSTINKDIASMVQTSVGVQYDPEVKTDNIQLDSFSKDAEEMDSNPDISGLELLSNSIEAFEKKTSIKQEPIDRSEQQLYTKTELRKQDEPPDDSVQSNNDFPTSDEHLGGLNLLCALAEQRFQEEVGHRSRKRSSSSEGSDCKKSKKHHKDKHSIKKSAKKSKHGKDRKEKKKLHHPSDDEEQIETNLKETFNRVKALYPVCACQNASNNKDKCCREKCNWPTPEEVYNAMKSDMRYRLAKIAREFQEEKRKLDDIKNIDKSNQSNRELTSSLKSSTASYFFAPETSKSESNINLSPIPSDSSQSDEQRCLEQNMSGSSQESCNLDDQDTNSSSSFKRKVDEAICSNDGKSDCAASKKAKSLVGYIFANKKKVNDSKNDNSPLVTDEASIEASDVSLPLLNTIKQEIIEECDLFGTAADKKHHKSKHPSKHKKSKSKERKHRRRSSEARERKKRIDTKCVLTEEFLDNLTGKTNPRVLTAMGGLFYAGCLSPIEPPDVYAVTLDGERGNRPHIMSREEILRDAILEVAPHSVNEVLPGTRLCAYWSQQYRCLYPGTVAQPGAQDYEVDSKFIIVEFDDGDSGRIALEDIRFLLSDYPIVEYDPNPLLTLGKRKQRVSQSHSEAGSIENAAETLSNINSLTLQNSQNIKEVEKKANKERRRLKKLRKDKLKQMGKDPDTDKKHKHKHKCSDELCKHRKHKKRRKHKKYRHDTVLPDSNQAKEIKQESHKTTSMDGEEEKNCNNVERIINNDEKKQEQNENVHFVPDVKEETMTEDDVASSITESSGSSYKPGKKKERQNSAENHSKIAAFLPARQLWAWAGKGIKRSGPKGRGKKQFFKTIQRGKEIITIGDSAVFLSTGRPDRPYIGRIESLWETSSSNRVVRVKWYYHPEETIGCPKLLYPGALFQSPHADENDVQTISHKCKVLPLGSYTQKYGPDPKQYGSVYDNNDCFYLAGYYDPTSITLKLENHIPTVPERAGES